MYEKYALRFDEINEQFSLAAKEARKVVGILSPTEFFDEFWENIPREIKWEIEQKGYRLEEAIGIEYQDRRMYLSYSHIFRKWVKKLPAYVYWEYDGTLSMKNDLEKHEEYKRDLKLYKRKLGCISSTVVYKECIFVGEKNRYGILAAMKFSCQKN